ncbi:MAG: hypothetical protein MR611_00350 [Coriobacteriaceae bacterium]|nr:hypothetical protein [Coriobacteriaceae bacterium]
MYVASSCDYPSKKHNHEIIRTDFLNTAKEVLGKAQDANQAIALRQMDVMAMQADEAEAAILSDNLDDTQKHAAVERSYAIRADMNYQAQRHTALNYLFAFGFMVLDAVS